MNREDKLLQEAAELEKRLESMSQQARKAHVAAESELQSLQQTYPGVVFAVAKGETSENQKLAMRARLQQLEADLQDFPVLYKHFETEQLRIQNLRRQADRIGRKRDHYEDLKARVQDPKRYGIAPVAEIRELARYLECEQDAEEFLSSLEHHVAA